MKDWKKAKKDNSRKVVAILADRQAQREAA